MRRFIFILAFIAALIPSTASAAWQTWPTFIGDFADDSAADTRLEAKGWDDGGSCQEPMSYYNTTSDTLRWCDSGTWSGTLAAGVDVDATGFSGNLSVTDDDVQTLAETVDALSLGGGGGFSNAYRVPMGGADVTYDWREGGTDPTSGLEAAGDYAAFDTMELVGNADPALSYIHVALDNDSGSEKTAQLMLRWELDQAAPMASVDAHGFSIRHKIDVLTDVMNNRFEGAYRASTATQAHTRAYIDSSGSARYVRNHLSWQGGGVGDFIAIEADSDERYLTCRRTMQYMSVMAFEAQSPWTRTHPGDLKIDRPWSTQDSEYVIWWELLFNVPHLAAIDVTIYDAVLTGIPLY